MKLTRTRKTIKKESLIEGELIEVRVEKVRKSGFGMLRGMRPFTEEDKFKGQLEENE